MVVEDKEPSGPVTRRALIFCNPASRLGAEVLPVVLNTLETSAIACEVLNGDGPSPLDRRLRDMPDAQDLVVAIGGDGTLNGVAASVQRSGLPLGIVPAGTGNDLARTLDLPLDPIQAALVIAAGKTKPIDVGVVNGHLFFNVASLGLSVRLADNLGQGLKRRWGRLGYVIAAIRALIEARPFQAQIVDDAGDKVAIRTLQIAVGNGRHYGGGMVIEEHATIDDGMLDLYSLEFDRVWKLFFMATTFSSGRHGLLREVRTVRGRSLEIRTRRPRPINTDGELTTFTPAVFSVMPKAIRVFVP